MAKALSTRKRGPIKDLSGMRFGKLTAISWAGNGSWLCDCECGNKKRVSTACLLRANTRSCGCLKRQIGNKRATTHGLYHTRAYKTWTSVKARCFKPSSGRSYQEYGGRGIGMDPVWAADPVAFVKDIGQPPTENHTLDRIDNDKGYFPGNVRWATPLEQGNNKRNNRIVTFQGKIYTLSQLARFIAGECGITHRQMLSAIEHEIYIPKDER